MVSFKKFVNLPAKRLWLVCVNIAWAKRLNNWPELVAYKQGGWNLKNKGKLRGVLLWSAAI